MPQGTEISIQDIILCSPQKESLDLEEDHRDRKGSRPQAIGAA